MLRDLSEGRYLSRPSRTPSGPRPVIPSGAQIRAQTAPVGVTRQPVLARDLPFKPSSTGSSPSFPSSPGSPFRQPTQPVVASPTILFRKGQLDRDRDADIRDVRSLPDLKDESPPPSQAKSDDLRRAIVNLVEVANGLSSNSFEDAWLKVQNYLKLLRKRVEVAQINVQENGSKLRDAQTNEKMVLAKADQQANDASTQKLNAVERLRQREEQDKLKASAKRGVAQYRRDYAKWRAELENARTDLEAAKAGTRTAQAARAAWIGEKLYGAAEKDPDGRRLRGLISELQIIGDEHVMSRLEAVAPHLEPWMRKAIAIYASWEREVSELTAEREAVGRRTAGNDGQ